MNPWRLACLESKRCLGGPQKSSVISLGPWAAGDVSDRGDARRRRRGPPPPRMRRALGPKGPWAMWTEGGWAHGLASVAHRRLVCPHPVSACVCTCLILLAISPPPALGHRAPQHGAGRPRRTAGVAALGWRTAGGTATGSVHGAPSSGDQQLAGMIPAPRATFSGSEGFLAGCGTARHAPTRAPLDRCTRRDAVLSPRHRRRGRRHRWHRSAEARSWRCIRGGRWQVRRQGARGARDPRGAARHVRPSCRAGCRVRCARARVGDSARIGPTPVDIARSSPGRIWIRNGAETC